MVVATIRYVTGGRHLSNKLAQQYKEDKAKEDTSQWMYPLFIFSHRRFVYRLTCLYFLDRHNQVHRPCVL